jgi:hypothetical protein
VEDLHEEIQYCRDTIEYIKRFVEFIKENVIRKYKDLDNISIRVKMFDKNNIIHRFMVNVVNTIKDLMHIKDKIDFYKSIYVSVYNGDERVFTGQINFTGLIL